MTGLSKTNLLGTTVDYSTDSQWKCNGLSKLITECLHIYLIPILLSYLNPKFTHSLESKKTKSKELQKSILLAQTVIRVIEMPGIPRPNYLVPNGNHTQDTENKAMHCIDIQAN